MLLRVSGLRRVLDGDRELFRGLSFDLRRGEALFVSGPSGVGKTLLLRCLAALDEAQVRHIACNVHARLCEAATVLMQGLEGGDKWAAWLGGQARPCRGWRDGRKGVAWLGGQARPCMGWRVGDKHEQECPCRGWRDGRKGAWLGGQACLPSPPGPLLGWTHKLCS